MRYRRGWIIIVCLAVLSPLGLLAIGGAWGEWGLEDIEEMVGFIPEGMRTEQEKQPDPLFPDYEVPGLTEGGWRMSLGTAVAALVGAGLTAGAVLVITRLIRYGRIS